MKPVPHGEPYAGKLHVRFDEGAGVPHGASRSTLHPVELPSYGTGPFLTTIAHEEASIDGIGANSAVKKRSNGPELIYSPR